MSLDEGESGGEDLRVEGEEECRTNASRQARAPFVGVSRCRRGGFLRVLTDCWGSCDGDGGADVGEDRVAAFESSIGVLFNWVSLSPLSSTLTPLFSQPC